MHESTDDIFKVPHTVLRLAQTINGKLYPTVRSDGTHVTEYAFNTAYMFKSITMTHPKNPTQMIVNGQYPEAKMPEMKDMWHLSSESFYIEANINETTDNVPNIYTLHRAIIGTSSLSDKGVRNLISKSRHIIFFVTDPKINEVVRISKIIHNAGAEDTAKVFRMSRDNLRECLLFLNSEGCDEVNIYTNFPDTQQMLDENLIDDIEIIVVPQFARNGQPIDLAFDKLELTGAGSNIFGYNQAILKYKVRK